MTNRIREALKNLAPCQCGKDCPDDSVWLSEAEQAINDYIKEIIGEDDRAAGDLDSDYHQGELNGRNQLRAEQRERAEL